MGVIGRTISSARQTADWRNNIRQNTDALLQAEQDRQRAIADRERSLAVTEYNAHRSILDDANQRLAMPEDQVVQTLGKMGAAAQRARSFGLDLPDVDPDPIPRAIAEEVFKLQSDASWRKTQPADRLRYLTNRYGNHWYKIEANYLNQQKMSGMQAGMAGAATATGAQESSAMPYEPNATGPQTPGQQSMPDPNAMEQGGAASQLQSVAMATPALSEFDRKAMEMFGDYYDGDENPKQEEQTLKDMLAGYGRMARNRRTESNPTGTPDELLETTRGEIMRLSGKLGFGVTETRLDGLAYAVEPPSPYQRLLDDDRKTDNLRQREQQIRSHIKELSLRASSNSDAMARTRQAREALYAVHAEQGIVEPLPPGELPDKYGFISPTTLQQDRTFEQRAKEFMQMFDLREDQQDLAMRNFWLAEQRHDLQERKFTYDQTKPRGSQDPLGRTPEAAAGKLGTTERAKFAPFFGENAMNYAPDSVRSAFSRAVQSEAIIYDDSLRTYIWNDGDDPETVKQVKQTRDAFGVIERDAPNKGKAAATVTVSQDFGDKGKMTDQFGNTYKADGCYKFVQNQIKGLTGQSVGDLRSLPKAGSGSSTKVQPGDAVELSPVGGYKSPHWVMVNPDGKTVSEFQSQKKDGTSVPIGISRDRTVDSLRSRILTVYRPKGTAQGGGKTDPWRDLANQVSNITDPEQKRAMEFIINERTGDPVAMLKQLKGGR